MKGKEKCKILKQIRKKIAEENDIQYVVEECKHKGECKGTCPKCEAELRELERELSLRRKIGKHVAVAGLAAGMIVTTTACTPGDVIDWVDSIMNPMYHQQVDGLMQPPVMGELIEPLEGDVSYQGYDELQYNEDKAEEETYCEETLADE
ncbi:MAG: hypothetical protein J5643_10855 [Lachnospiraceae bacterium]|nr:hypothetical protein [Lachnospiraceae bacterium]